MPAWEEERREVTSQFLVWDRPASSHIISSLAMLDPQQPSQTWWTSMLPASWYQNSSRTDISPNPPAFSQKACHATLCYSSLVDGFFTKLITVSQHVCMPSFFAYLEEEDADSLNAASYYMCPSLPCCSTCSLSCLASFPSHNSASAILQHYLYTTFIYYKFLPHCVSVT